MKFFTMLQFSPTSFLYKQCFFVGHLLVFFYIQNQQLSTLLGLFPKTIQKFLSFCLNSCMMFYNSVAQYILTYGLQVFLASI